MLRVESGPVPAVSFPVGMQAATRSVANVRTHAERGYEVLMVRLET
jgi:hypothetical protein